MMFSPEPYKISLTTGGLFYREALRVAALYRKLGDWQIVNQTVRSQNLLQARTQSSLGRTTQELLQRLQVLTTDELNLLLEGARSEQQHMLWLATCKQYRFVHEFAIEVVREKFLRFDMALTYSDFDAFFFARAEWHPELEQITLSTRKKVRQVLFRILAEAQIISPQKEILPQVLSASVAQAIRADNPALLLCFPMSDADILRLKTL